jgi:xanthine dehydrogenase accessory factor
MTISFQSVAKTSDLLSDEDVLPQLKRWQAEGQKTALVTLIAVEGGAPRQSGAQMAVAADGRYAGYLSGGCLEQAVALEAQAVIAAGAPKLIRFGKGSPYFDVKLPCGSGFDLYFNAGPDAALLARAATCRGSRKPFAIRTVISTGQNTLDECAPDAAIEPSQLEGGIFKRTYSPALRLLILGTGPSLIATAKLATTLGIELIIRSQDDETRRELFQSGLETSIDDGALTTALQRLDFASAALLFFHDHEHEPDILDGVLKTPCFYIGVLGNHAVHRARLSVLESRGVGTESLSRIRAPVGLIAGAKSKATLAIGVLAELMIEAKARNLVS